MELKELIYAGLVAGGGMSALYSLKDIPIKFYKSIKDRFIYKVSVQDNDELYLAIENYLYKNHNNTYRSVNAYIKDSEGKIFHKYSGFSMENNLYSGNYSVAYKQDSTIFYIKFNGKYILFEKSKNKIENAQTVRDLFSYCFIIKSIGGKKVINQLLENIATDWNKQINGDDINIYVYKYGCWDKHGRKNVKSINEIILDENLKKEIINDLNEFENKKDWYENLSITYKRNYLFHGLAGCGKTTLSMSIASKLKRNLCIINISSLKGDDQLIHCFSSIPENSILLFEDIDSAFVERKSEDKISFSCLLNCLDGSLSKNGLITIMTTNHIDRLDYALLRDGRIDFKKEIEPAKTKEIEEFVNMFYSCNEKIEKNIKIPMSSVQEICIRNKNSIINAINEIINLNK